MYIYSYAPPQRSAISGSAKLLMTEPSREQERLIPKAKASSLPCLFVYKFVHREGREGGVVEWTTQDTTRGSPFHAHTYMYTYIYNMYVNTRTRNHSATKLD